MRVAFAIWVCGFATIGAAVLARNAMAEGADDKIRWPWVPLAASWPLMAPLAIAAHIWGLATSPRGADA